MSQRNDYTAGAGQTEFTYTFQIFQTDEIFVYQNEVLLTELVDYTVSNNALPAIGGTVTLITGATAGDSIALVQAIPNTRLIEYQTDGDWKADTVNEDFNRLYTLLNQALGTTADPNNQISDRLLRFATAVDRSSATNLYPTPTEDQLLAWDANGDLKNITLPSLSAAAGAIVPNVTSLKAIDVSTTTDAYLQGLSTQGDGGQNNFYYDAASTDTPDDQLVIKPDSVTLPDPGRWLALGVADRTVSKDKSNWLPYGVREGLDVTNNTGDPDHDIDVAVGNIMDSTDNYLIRLESPLTKRVDETFAVGNGGGLSDQDTLSADSWYRVFLIAKKSDLTDCDVIFATDEANALADTVAAAAGFDIARRICWVLTDGSSNIIEWLNDGENRYRWDVPAAAVGGLSTGGLLITLNVPPNQVGMLQLLATSDTATTLGVGIITSSSQTNTIPDAFTNDIIVDGTGTISLLNAVHKTHKVDSSSQVRSRTSASGILVFNIRVHGWIDDIAEH